jgi:hypothetical protein
MPFYVAEKRQLAGSAHLSADECDLSLCAAAEGRDARQSRCTTTRRVGSHFFLPTAFVGPLEIDCLVNLLSTTFECA